MMRLVLLAVGGLLIGLTILSRVRSAKWWVRYADFPRVQIAFGLAVVLAAYVAFYGTGSALDALFTLAIGGALLEQGIRIFPYTPLAPKEVVELEERAGKAGAFGGLLHVIWLLLMIDMIWKPGLDLLS